MDYRNPTENNHNKNKLKKQYLKKSAKPGIGVKSHFQNYHIIRYKCLVFNNNKIARHTKKQEYGPFKGEKKSTENVLEKDLMADLLDKNIKNNCLKDVKELKDEEKVKKTMYEQNGNINKDIEKN